MGQHPAAEPPPRPLGLTQLVADGQRGDTRVTRPHNDKPASKPSSPQRRRPATPGLATRQAAVRVITAVLKDHRSLDEALTASDALEPRDRGLARLIAGTVIRRQGGRIAWVANAPDDLSSN